MDWRRLYENMRNAIGILKLISWVRKIFSMEMLRRKNTGFYGLRLPKKT